MKLFVYLFLFNLLFWGFLAEEESHHVIKCIQRILDKGLSEANIPNLGHVSVNEYNIPIDLLGHKGEIKLNDIKVEGIQEFDVINMSKKLNVNENEHFCTFRVINPELNIEGTVSANVKGEWLQIDNFNGTFKISIKYLSYNGLMNTTFMNDGLVHLNDYGIFNMKIKGVEVKVQGMNVVKDALISSILTELIEFGVKWEPKNRYLSNAIFRRVHEILMNRGKVAAIKSFCNNL